MSYLVSIFELPIHHLLPFPLFGLFALVYSLAAPSFATEKQRAYILSSFTSASMTLVSLPYVWSDMLYGLKATYEDAQIGWRRDVAMCGMAFFATYLAGKQCVIL